jgi:hypothetical protein
MVQWSPRRALVFLERPSLNAESFQLFYEEHLKETIQSGHRRQDALNPQKYRYVQAFADLPEGNTHIVAIAFFRFRQGDDGKPHPNNDIVTAYMRELG